MSSEGPRGRNRVTVPAEGPTGRWEIMPSA